MNGDIDPPHGLTYVIRHSVQMRCWEKLAPQHRCVNVTVTRDTQWDEELPGEGRGHHLKSITKVQDS